MNVVTRLGAPASSISMLEVGGYILPVNAAGTPAPNEAPNGEAAISETERRSRLYQHMIEAAKQPLAAGSQTIVGIKSDCRPRTTSVNSYYFYSNFGVIGAAISHSPRLRIQSAV